MQSEQTLQKWGNSLGLRLPKEMAEQFSLTEGSTLILTIEKRGISLRPANKKREGLKKLVAKITPQNKHGVIDWGESRGKEIW